MEHLRAADTDIDPQFYFSGKYQFPNNYKHPPLSWGGEIVSVPVGLPNPWGLISSFSLFLLLIFRVDATITVWRRGDRRRALLVGGSMIFGAILAWHVPLVIWGVVEVPFFLGFTYTAVLAAMGYELTNDMGRAGHLAHELELSDKRLSLAADSADLGLWEWDLSKDKIWITPKRRAQLGFPVSGKITVEDLICRWHPDDRDKVRQALRDAIENGKDYNSEFRRVLADGSVRWVAARGRVNANGFQDAGESSLTGWPFCINPLDGGTPALVTQLTANGGCATWSNLTTPGDYVVTEANANETNWFHSTGGTSMIMLASGGTETRTFGNYCVSPSGGLTLGFWSNKNGNKVLTGNTGGNGTTLLAAVTNLLNNPCTGGGKFVNANGSIHTFSTHADLKSWLLGANATNMAYMLSAQMATLLLDTHYGATIGSLPAVDGNAFDLCSHATVNALIGEACDALRGPGNQLTLSGNPSRPGQEMLKNCIDAINNNGAVVPVTPCPYSFTAGNPCP